MELEGQGARTTSLIFRKRLPLSRHDLSHPTSTQARTAEANRTKRRDASVGTDNMYITEVETSVTSLQYSADPPCLTRTRQLPLPAGLELNRREPSLGATHGGAVIGRCVRAATGGEEARSASTSAAIRASKLASLRPPLVGPTSAPARARLSATSRWPERHA